MICTPYQFYSGDQSKRLEGHVTLCESGEVRAVFWWGDPMEICHLKDLGIGGRMILKGIILKWVWARGQD